MSYDVLKNRLTNGKAFMTSAAVARVTALADELVITQEQAEELTALANANGMAEVSTVEERLAALEAASLEHDLAIVELAAILTGEEVIEDDAASGEVLTEMNEAEMSAVEGVV